MSMVVKLQHFHVIRYGKSCGEVAASASAALTLAADALDKRAEDEYHYARLVAFNVSDASSEDLRSGMMALAAYNNYEELADRARLTAEAVMKAAVKNSGGDKALYAVRAVITDINSTSPVRVSNCHSNVRRSPGGSLRCVSDELATHR